MVAHKYILTADKFLSQFGCGQHIVGNYRQAGGTVRVLRVPRFCQCKGFRMVPDACPFIFVNHTRSSRDMTAEGFLTQQTHARSLPQVPMRALARYRHMSPLCKVMLGLQP